MKTKRRIAALVTISATSFATAQNIPVSDVRLFAPDVISGPANDGSPTFSPDGRTLFFTRSAAHWTVILESHLVEGAWSKPAIAPFSGQWPDSRPAWSPDGKYVIFQSTRPKATLLVTPSSGEPSPRLVSNLWRVDRTVSGWSEPVRLPDTVNIGRSIWKPSIAANGDLFLTVIGSGSTKSICVSTFRNGAYQKATPLPFSDGTKVDVDPEIAPDESFLVFSSAGRLNGDTHERLFLVKHQNGAWGMPTLIRYRDDVTKFGASTDNEPRLGRDGTTLYFSSDRTVVAHFPRTKAQAEADLNRLERWDNSNSNVWIISLKGLL